MVSPGLLGNLMWAVCCHTGAGISFTKLNYTTAALKTSHYILIGENDYTRRKALLPSLQQVCTDVSQFVLRQVKHKLVNNIRPIFRSVSENRIEFYQCSQETDIESMSTVWCLHTKSTHLINDNTFPTLKTWISTSPNVI